MPLSKSNITNIFIMKEPLDRQYYMWCICCSLTFWREFAGSANDHIELVIWKEVTSFFLFFLKVDVNWNSLFCFVCNHSKNLSLETGSIECLKEKLLVITMGICRVIKDLPSCGPLTSFVSVICTVQEIHDYDWITSFLYIYIYIYIKR